MNTAHRIEFFYTEDGDPFALFCWGDVPDKVFTTERCIEAVMHHGGYDRDDAAEIVAKAGAIGPLWLREDKDADEDDGYRYHLCAADHPDAQRITGARF